VQSIASFTLYWIFLKFSASRGSTYEIEDTNVKVVDGRLIRCESAISEVKLHDMRHMTVREAEIRDELM
jgi:hypothetical protein